MTLVIAVLVALIGLVPQYLSRTIPDVAFPLWAAGRVLDGATLYVDILEINPPLFIWLDVPVVAFARWTGLDPILVFRLAVTALLVLSVVGVLRVMGGTRDVNLSAEGAKGPGPWRGWAVVAVTFVLFVLPRLDWGEREHLTLALMLPWLAVAIRRVEGRYVSRPMALVTGLAAGVGIALKPHFVLVWVGREVAIRLGGSAARRLGHHSGLSDRRLDGQTDGYWWARADTWTPVVVCVAYLTAAVVFTPEYFPLVRELAGPYSQFIRATVLETMFGPAPALALASLVIAVGLRQLLPAEPLGRRAATGVLWWATAAWAVVALLQLKGFRYHWYPAMALGLLLLCELALVARGVHISFTSRLFRAIGTAAVVTCVLLTSWGALRQARTPLAPEWDADPSIGPLLEALDGLVEPGDTLAVLSPNMASGFPLTNYLGTVWPLRLSNIWPAVVSYRESLERSQSPELRPTDAMISLERWSVEAVERDLRNSNPEWVLIFRHLPGPGSSYMAKLNIRTFLTRNDNMQKLWHNYDSLEAIGSYTLWRSRQ